eukprot:gene16196-22359_t
MSMLPGVITQALKLVHSRASCSAGTDVSRYHATQWGAPWRGFKSGLPSYEAETGGHMKMDKFRVLPFLMSKTKAEEAFNQHHSNNPLLAPLSKYNKVKEVLLPFWCMRARVQVKLKSAQIGHHVFRTSWNVAKGRLEPQWEVEWQTVAVERTWANEYHPEHEGMQVYANHKYPRPDIQVMRPGASLVTAVPLHPRMMGSASSPGLLRRVQAYKMPPDAARRFAINYVWKQEKAGAEELLKQMMGVSEVRVLDMSVTVTYFSAHPVYVPMYVFSRKSARGYKVRTFVSGVDGATSGTREYDATKVATLSAAFGAVVMLVLPAVIVTSLPLASFIWVGMSAFAVLGSWVANYFPELRGGWLALGDLRQRYFGDGLKPKTTIGGWGRGDGFPKSGDAGDWEAEFVKQYMGTEERRRSFEDRSEYSQHGRQSEDSWSDSGLGKDELRDPLGYYQILGVGLSASTSEIASAFRGAALKHHPDMYPDQADQQRATAHFQRIMVAYSVLRDPAKRLEYDSGTYTP